VSIVLHPKIIIEVVRVCTLDCSNKDYLNHQSYKFAKNKNIAYFRVNADTNSGEIDFFHKDYNPNCKAFNKEFNNKTPGVIISNLLAGITVEEARKYLFKKNIKKFNRPIWIYENSKMNKILYANNIRTEILLNKTLYHNLLGNNINERLGRTKIDTNNLYEFNVFDKKILVLGCGALGNFSTLMLSNFSDCKIDFVDFDKFENHNIIRQYLAYNSEGKFKSRVLSRSIKTINDSIRSSANIGYLGNYLPDDIVKKVNNLVLIDKEWIKNKEYDAILGCFDRKSARKTAANFAYELKIPYIDAGSGADPTRSKVYIYNPKQRDLTIENLFNSIDLDQSIIDSKWRDLVREQRKNNTSDFEYFMQGRSCSGTVSGSVSMGNQVASALMISELRKILNPQYYGSAIALDLSYKSSLVERIGVDFD